MIRLLRPGAQTGVRSAPADAGAPSGAPEDVSLGALADLVTRETGIALRPNRLPWLAVTVARLGSGMTAGQLLARRVEPGILDGLIDQVTVRETYLFRNPGELETIDWPAMLVAARERGVDRPQVWVAGCASGEEAYTVAIMACRALSRRDPPVRIVATDIAPAALRQAERGRCLAQDGDALRAAIGDRYLEPLPDGSLSVQRGLRSLVTFGRHNLVRDPPPSPGDFDLVICRNVLIYFDADTTSSVATGLRAAVVPGGTLLLGAADRLAVALATGTHHPHAPGARGPTAPGARRPTVPG